MKNVKTSTRGLLAALALLGLHTGATAAEWVLVASAKSSMRSLDMATAESLYMGKTSDLPGIGAVAIHDLPEGNAVRDAFYQETSNKNASAMKAYWSRMIFTGKGQPPKVVDSSAALKKALAANPAAIGYLEKSAVDASVKVLLAP